MGINRPFIIQAREGFQNVCGVDYSETAINLASSIASKLGLQSSISFKVRNQQYANWILFVCIFVLFIEIFFRQVCDLIAAELNDNYYSIAHDKGTYDAICLHPESPKEKRSTYICKVHRLLKENGLFIITSCNWTDNEIITHFKARKF